MGCLPLRWIPAWFTPLLRGGCVLRHGGGGTGEREREEQDSGDEGTGDTHVSFTFGHDFVRLSWTTRCLAAEATPGCIYGSNWPDVQLVSGRDD
jgi:hypothetical protein